MYSIEYEYRLRGGLKNNKNVKAGPLTKLNKSLSTDQTIHVNNMQLLCYENVSQKKQSKLFGPKNVLYIC